VSVFSFQPLFQSCFTSNHLQQVGEGFKCPWLGSVLCCGDDPLTLCVYIYLDISKSVEYSQKTMDEALQKVKEMRADLGGTEILQPLKHIYSQPCLPDQPRQVSNTPYIPYSALDREAQQSQALHFSARGVTTDPGSIPGCITTGRDWESHRAAHNWPSVVRISVWPG
jgi:hypothetical protein